MRITIMITVLALLCMPLLGCDWIEERAPTVGDAIGDRIDELSDSVDAILDEL